MKKYVGVKLIEAKPMTRGDYNNYRGWTIPKKLFYAILMKKIKNMDYLLMKYLKRF